MRARTYTVWQGRTVALQFAQCCSLRLSIDAGLDSTHVLTIKPEIFNGGLGEHGPGKEGNS
jgi:hypothetical protein